MTTSPNAPDSFHSPFSPGVRAQLEQAMRSYAALPLADRHDELQRAFEQLSAEAHHAELPAEVVLLAVKEVWWRSHAGTAMYHTPQRDAYDRMVHWCLAAYFDEPR